MNAISFSAPIIEKRVVCISADYVLAAQISSCFNQDNIYFSVLEPPRSMKKYWSNDNVRLNNVLSRINADRIILANLNNKLTEYIKRQLNLSESKYIYIKKRSEIKRIRDFFNLTCYGVLECPPEEEKIAYALLQAKRNNLQLIIKNGVVYEPEFTSKRTSLIESDSCKGMNSVVLANYAYSIDSDLHFFNNDLNFSPIEIDSLIEDSRQTGKRGEIARNLSEEIKSELSSKLSNIKDYGFVTFFTTELHYGYFFPEIPSSHIYNDLLTSHFLARSISQPKINVNSALLVDAGFFKDSETDTLNDILSQKEVFIKELREHTFTNLELDNTIQFFPYDFLHICSHGGLPEGMRFKIKFNDSKGCDHIITVDLLDSFDPTNEGEGDNRIINVKTFYEFIDLDGKPWYLKEYKKGSSKSVVEDFLAIGRGNWEVLEKSNGSRMRHCNIISTKDPLGPYNPMLHSISDPFSMPFIFNNACFSTFTLGINFIFAGASFYIGTIRAVNNSDAIKVANLFYEKTIIEQKTFAISLWEAQRESDLIAEDYVHTSVGCHFMKFNFPEGIDNIEEVKRRIKTNAIMRKKSIERENIEKSTKKNHLSAIEFLIEQYDLIN